MKLTSKLYFQAHFHDSNDFVELDSSESRRPSAPQAPDERRQHRDNVEGRGGGRFFNSWFVDDID